MSELSIVLVGGPDSGKTNYIGRLWAALNGGTGLLQAVRPPEEIGYVEAILAHLLYGQFAPRSGPDLESQRSDLSISIRLRGRASPSERELSIPDALGELWKRAVETSELPEKWMAKLNESCGALLFVRVLSDQNVTPLDWVTAGRLLRMHGGGTAEGHDAALPTQVFLSELLRFLELTLKPEPGQLRPRVSIVVTAWDLLDGERSEAGPDEYLRREYPIFAGRVADTDRLDVKVFGVSVVGGDLDEDEEFKKKYESIDIRSSGYVVTRNGSGLDVSDDLTLPVAWLLAP